MPPEQTASRFQKPTQTLFRNARKTTKTRGFSVFGANYLEPEKNTISKR